MAGRPVTRARREAAEREREAAGLCSNAVCYGLRGHDGACPAPLVDAGGDSADYTSSAQSPASTQARTVADHRQRLMKVADACLVRLESIADRDVSQVYKDVTYLLMKLEAQDKDPTPRPEDVRKGVVDMLAMLPDLCMHDTELRELAVNALARIVEQSE